MAKVRAHGDKAVTGGRTVDTPNPPNGVASPPPDAADGSQAFYDWLAQQPSATREWYIEGRFNAIAKQSDPTARKTEARSEQDKLQSAQESAISQGKQLPADTDPVSGTGMHFSSDKQRLEFLRNSGTNIAKGDKAKSDALTPADTTVNPTYVPLDPEAAHPENVYQHYGAVTPEQVAQQHAIDQTRTDTTGVDAAKQSLTDETAAINQGGLTAIDRARLEQARALRAQQARSAEGAIRQQAEQQGRAGSTASLVMRQGAQQGAENARSQDDLQTMALGLQRKDTLMGQRASEGMTVQNSQDAIDKFNTEGARSVDSANTLAQNSANTRTSEEQNKRETGNVDITNSGIGQGMNYRTNVLGTNTGIANTAEDINKSPTGGARGLALEGREGSAPLIEATSRTAADTKDFSIQNAALEAQSKTQGWNLAGNLIGAATSAFVPPLLKRATSPTGS